MTTNTEEKITGPKKSPEQQEILAHQVKTAFISEETEAQRDGRLPRVPQGELAGARSGTGTAWRRACWSSKRAAALSAQPICALQKQRPQVQGHQCLFQSELRFHSAPVGSGSQKVKARFRSRMLFKRKKKPKQNLPFPCWRSDVKELVTEREGPTDIMDKWKKTVR